MAIADFPFSFASQPIIDPTTGQPVLNATGGVLQDPRTGNALGMADMNGNPISTVTGNAFGMSQPFRSTQLAVLVKFGNVYVQAPAIEIFDALQIAGDAVSLSQQSAASAAQASAAALAAQALIQSIIANGGGGSGVSDHGALSGLGDDDHTQYHNDTRGDARYYTKAQSDANTSAAAFAQSTDDRNRANHTGTQLASSISNLTTTVRGIMGVPFIATYTAAQGKPTQAQLAAAGVPDGSLIVVDSA